MMNKITNIFRNLMIIGVLCITIVFSLSCNNSEYRTFTFKKGVNFTFEYPSHYKKDSIGSYVEGRIAGGVTFHDKLPSDGNWYDVIFIVISDKRTGYTTPKEAIEAIITDSLTKEIIERTTVTMAGLPGELLVYSYPGWVTDGPSGILSCSSSHSKVDKAPIRVNRVAYFDDGSKIWMIEIESAERKAEQAKADFDHILQTFKILK